MAGSVNKVILIGNLGRDPDIRFNPEGGKIVTLSIATSESWKDKASGERRDRTEWHKVVVFNDKLAEICEKYLKKGSKVYLEGQLQTRKWTNQQGQDQYTTEVILGKYRGEMTLLDSRGSDGEENGKGEGSEILSSMGISAGSGRLKYSDLGSSGGAPLNDEVPF